MSGANTSVIINIGARVGEALRGLGKVNEAFEEQGNATSKWEKGVSKSMKVAGAAVATGALAAAAGIALVAKEMIDMGREAVENEKNAAILANTLRNVGVPEDQIEANERWVRSMRIGSLVAKDELRQSVSDLTLATGDLSKAQDLATLAWDAAIASGKGYEEISDALVEAQKGETNALIEQFQWLKVNEDGTIDYASAIKQLEKRYKGAAAEAAKRDPWVRLKAIWDELRIALGNWLIPLVEKFGDWFSDPKNQKKIEEFLDRMQRFAETVGVAAVEALEDLYDWLQSPEGKRAIADFSRNMQTIIRWVSKVIGWIQSGVGWIQTFWGWLQKLKDSPLGRPLLPELRAGAAPRATQTAVVGAAARSFSAPAAAGRSVGSNATINIMTNDPFRAGAVVKRMLEGNDVVQGRPRGRPLALAW